jgi:hypothetical protein
LQSFQDGWIRAPHSVSTELSSSDKQKSVVVKTEVQQSVAKRNEKILFLFYITANKQKQKNCIINKFLFRRFQNLLAFEQNEINKARQAISRRNL